MGEQVSRVRKQANDDVLTVVPISVVAMRLWLCSPERDRVCCRPA
jgi:hypothetical protein